MRKKKLKVLLLSISMVTLLIAGCNTQKSSNENKKDKNITTTAYNESALKDGLKYISDDKLDKAKNRFEEAIDFNNKDQKAKNYLKQLNMVIAGDNFNEQKDYKNADKSYSEAIKFKNGSSVIKDRAENKQNALKKQKEIDHEKSKSVSENQNSISEPKVEQEPKINNNQVENNKSEDYIQAEKYLNMAESSINAGEQSTAWNILIQSGVDINVIRQYPVLKQRAYNLAMQLDGHEDYQEYIDQMYKN